MFVTDEAAAGSALRRARVMGGSPARSSGSCSVCQFQSRIGSGTPCIPPSGVR
jgi:hypothetical protein